MSNEPLLCRVGWVERQQGTVSNNMILLMQAEVERFHAGVLLLHDYYQTKVQEVTHDNSVVLVSGTAFGSLFVKGFSCVSTCLTSRLNDSISRVCSWVLISSWLD